MIDESQTRIQPCRVNRSSSSVRSASSRPRASRSVPAKGQASRNALLRLRRAVQVRPVAVVRDRPSMSNGNLPRMSSHRRSHAGGPNLAARSVHSRASGRPRAHCAAREAASERAEHPMNRIIAVETRPDGVEITRRVPASRRDPQRTNTTGTIARCTTFVATDPITMFATAPMPRVPM